MIYRIYPTKDTWITNRYILPNATRLTGANVGQSEELQVFKQPGISGAIGSLGSSSLGRALLQFDFTAFTALTASGDIPTAGGTFTLRLNHKTHGDTLPFSFDLTVEPVSSSWDEGRGIDVVLGDAGVANWERRNGSNYWTTFGGDFLSANVTSSHFDTGYEDLEADVTSLVNSWNSGTVPNNGLAVAMTATVEADSNYGNYYVKKFYSRQSDYEDRRPYIEYRVNDFVGDDRANMQWNRTGSLFIYNVVGGQFVDLAGQVVMAVSDASGVLLTVTASHGTTGIYSASFALPTGSYSGSLFYDSWRAGGVSLTTGTFTFATPPPVTTLTQNVLTARIRNMQTEYLPEDVVLFEVLFRKKNHVVPVLSTSSLNTVPYIVEHAYYAIENDATRERVVPFGTGSQLHTRLSYGGTGNSFRLYMTNLHSGNVYRVVLLVNEQGRRQIVDPGFRFKIA